MEKGREVKAAITYLIYLSICLHIRLSKSTLSPVSAVLVYVLLSVYLLIHLSLIVCLYGICLICISIYLPTYRPTNAYLFFCLSSTCLYICLIFYISPYPYLSVPLYFFVCLSSAYLYAYLYVYGTNFLLTSLYIYLYLFIYLLSYFLLFISPSIHLSI